MQSMRVRPPGRRAIGHLVSLAAILLVLVGVVYWGVTHRPIRRREGALPPTVSVAQDQASPQPRPTAAVATPTRSPSPNRVVVYTLDGREVCAGDPVGDLGYNLQCAVPAGVRFFRVVDSNGRSTLAIPYNDQVLVRVGPQ